MTDKKFVGTPKKATTHVNQNEDLIFEKSSPGKKAYRLAELDVPAIDAASLLGDSVRTDLGVMPELSEIEIIRHFTRLSTWNYAIDLGMYPLGSCTMKYNPRVNEFVARLEGLATEHPSQPAELSQAALGKLRGPRRVFGGEAFQARDKFIDPRVVFHGAGTQRIHAEIDGVIPSGKASEVADDFDLADFRETFDRCAGKFRTENGDRVDRRNVERRQFHPAFAGKGMLEDQPFVLAGVRAHFADVMRGGFGLR